MPFVLSPMPPQPSEQTWAFVRDLAQKPVHEPIRWTRRQPGRNEANLRDGARLLLTLADPTGLLETAIADFRYFMQCAGLLQARSYSIEMGTDANLKHEEFVLHITSERCAGWAADTEGARRALVWLEDEMLRGGGPFLPLGTHRRTPSIRTRISRCFYGPVNRPPKCRDELTDGVDYYPDAYLNRLAHEGVNALWLTLHFFQTVPSRIIPEYGRNAQLRLEKLRRTVAKCARYGIRIYPFCIEPAAFTWNYPEVRAAARAHPDLSGHRGAFCTSTEKGQAYLEEATRTLFSEVPGLGGLIVIPVGERLTHCYSSTIADGPPGGGTNTCPRCATRKPHEVLADTLAGLARGMREAAPEAELIAWPYGQFIGWGAERTIEAAGHIPKGVILQHNFETGGHNTQLAIQRPTWDYWLSYVGPSDLFRRAAEAARTSGTRTSAKLQVGCSHETATTQYVPVPGILWQKYAAMRKLGVSAAMHSWYFGAYPSLMTKAAGELSFDPFPKQPNDFLMQLAQRDWGDAARELVRAWRHFETGYRNYPTTHIFGYYGPMHDGPVWPLYLTPRRLPLAPTWQIGYPPSGDYIAECVTSNFTLDEMVTLCERMSKHWDKGVRILQEMRRRFAKDETRLRDIGVAEALGLQFRSGSRILRFYQLRERLADTRNTERRKAVLRQMKEIVQEEIRGSRTLIPLAEADSRLGFHSEAEGYKYYPALLHWRIMQLKRLLSEEFPEIERRVEENGALFPEYTGKRPANLWLASVPREKADVARRGECLHGLRAVFNMERWRRTPYDAQDHLALSEDDMAGRTTTWYAIHDKDTLTFHAECAAGKRDGFAGNRLEIWIEPVRTKPRIIFSMIPDGATRCTRDDGYIPNDETPWKASSRVENGVWHVSLRVPLCWLRGSKRHCHKPMRMNVLRTMPLPNGTGDTGNWSWVARQPAKGRLVWATLNPATDFGWLKFNKEDR